jgi:hypothetical protein
MLPLSALIYSEDGGSWFSCNVGTYLRNYILHNITSLKKVYFLQAVTFFITLHDENEESNAVYISQVF